MLNNNGDAMNEKITKFDFSKLDFDVLREREQQEAMRRRAEMERIRREEEEAAAAPPPVRYDEEEYNTAVAEALEKGRIEGLKQATSEQNREILDLLKTAVPKILELCDEEEKRKNSFEEKTVVLALLILKKALPALMEKEAAGEIEAFIRAAVKSAENADKLRITVPTDLKDVIRERITTMADDKTLLSVTEIIGDADIPPGTCRVEWSGVSGAEKSIGNILSKIDGIAECYLTSGNKDEKCKDNGNNNHGETE